MRDFKAASTIPFRSIHTASMGQFQVDLIKKYKIKLTNFEVLSVFKNNLNWNYI